MALTKIPANLLDKSSHVDFADGEELRIGNGNDLRIFHAGTENFIRGNATESPLYIDVCQNLHIRHLDTDGGNAETMIKGIGDGAVELYHNNQKKFETTSGGASVTGNLAISGNLTVSGTTTELDTTNLNVTDKNITLNYHASSDTSSNADGAGITIQDAVNGSTDATLNWSASNDRFVMSHGLQVTSGNVGIGTTSVDGTLHLDGGTSSDLIIEKDDTGNAAVRFHNAGSQLSYISLTSAEDMIYYGGSGVDQIFWAGGSERMLIDSSGMLLVNTQSSWGGETTPHIESRGDVAGDYTGLIVSNTNDAAGDTVSVNFGLARDGGLVFGNAGKITVGKEQDWTTTASTVDGFMSFSTMQNESLTERMRIDSSGNLLVGKTTGSSATAGHRFNPNGSQESTASGTQPLYLNRLSSDGNIIVFDKDNSTVGNISSEGGDALIIQSGTTSGSGLLFHPSNGQIYPVRNSLKVDNAIDLGRSVNRFKDIYFSGGLYGGVKVQTDTIGVGTVAAGGSVGRTTSENDGIFWHNSKTDYAIYRTAGTWSGSYQQLKLDWDTGIYIDGGTSYGESGVHISEKVSLGDSSYSNFGSPNYPVHICGDGYSLMVESGTGYSHFGSNNTTYFHIVGNRYYYFGQRCEASGGFHTYSDENLKKEITPITGALDDVAKMNGVTFKWKDAAKRGGGDAGKQFGVTAQNMLTVDSELPTKNVDPLYNIEDSVSADDEYYTMDYSRITPFLIEAVKELKTKLEAAEARIKILEG